MYYFAILLITCYGSRMFSNRLGLISEKNLICHFYVLMHLFQENMLYTIIISLEISIPLRNLVD